MKKFVIGSLLTLGAASVLAGCGLIPPQELPANLLNLEGKTLSADLLATSAPVNTRTPGAGVANASATFNDLTWPTIPFDPSSVEITLELAKATVKSTATPTNACATSATDVLVTLSNFKVDLSDGVGPSARMFTKTIPSVSLHINPSNGSIGGLDASALKVSITEIALIKSILTTPPSPNSVNASTNISTSPALPGCTLTFTFGPGKAFARL
jgi:hypothetical protein